MCTIIESVRRNELTVKKKLTRDYGPGCLVLQTKTFCWPVKAFENWLLQLNNISVWAILPHLKMIHTLSFSLVITPQDPLDKYKATHLYIKVHHEKTKQNKGKHLSQPFSCIDFACWVCSSIITSIPCNKSTVNEVIRAECFFWVEAKTRTSLYRFQRKFWSISQNSDFGRTYFVLPHSQGRKGWERCCV